MTIKMPEKTKKGYTEAHEGDGVYIDRPHQKRGVVQRGMIQTIKTSGNDVGVVAKEKRTIVYDDYNSRVRKDQSTIGVITGNIGIAAPRNAYNLLEYERLRIRRLTPKECYRLMGFSDEDFDKARAVGMRNTQLYKQAGNSIVVNVLAELFKQIFNSNGEITV